MIIKKKKISYYRMKLKKKINWKKKTIKQSIIPVNSALQGGVQ
jgi:hypothetical protein